MRCWICDALLTEKELESVEPDGSQKPCFICQEAIKDALEDNEDDVLDPDWDDFHIEVIPLSQLIED